MKKFVSMVLTLAMVVLLAAPAYTSPAMAATPRAQELAEMLYAADLFRGYGKDAAGQPIFGLDDTATRAESLVMLVRMLGKEAEARNTNYTTPFTDIPDWCKGEIGYGYTAELTSGTSETTFSPAKTVTNTEFLVFALRALGYTSGSDYEWARAAVKAAELGVIATGEYTDSKNTFTRGDMVIVAYGALTTKVKGSDKTLAETLGLNLKPVEKPVPKPGTGTGIPAVDKVVGTVDIYTEFDGWLKTQDGSGEKRIYIEDLPDGTIIKDIGEGRDTSKTFEESLEVFLANLYKIDHNVQYRARDGGFIGRGEDISLGESEGYRLNINKAICIMSTFFKDDQFNRTIVLNSMSYFGNKDMASKVYAMIFDHYSSRKDNDKVITPEFAAQYGLTIKHEFSYLTCLKRAGGTVSDGVHTWGLVYNTTNLESKSGQQYLFTVEIPA